MLVYKPDKTKNYELGAKGTALGLINYTADVFFIDWNNFQLDSSSYYGGYPLSANGTKARSKGVELSFDGKLGGHFSYAVGYAYTVAQVAQNFAILDRLDDGTGNLAAIVNAQKGDPLPNSPKNSATLSLDYGHLVLPFSPDWSMRYHLDGNYRSSTYSRLLNTIPGAPPPFLLDGFTIWNASVNVMDTHGLSFSPLRTKSVQCSRRHRWARPRRSRAAPHQRTRRALLHRPAAHDWAACGIQILEGFDEAGPDITACEAPDVN